MLIKKSVFIQIFLFGFYGILYSQQLNKEHFGFLITDLENLQTIAYNKSNVAFCPASITKLITTATALEVLGKDFRFRTDIQINGIIKDSVLIGNLIIKGGGDPTIGSSYFPNSRDFLHTWSKAVKQFGIRHIEGNIIADLSIFDSQALPSYWESPDIGNYYAAGVYGLSFFDNILAITFKSGKVGSTPRIIEIIPSIEGIVIDNRLVSAKGVGDNAFFEGIPYDNNRKITGSIEANVPKFIIKADIGNPPMVLLQSLKENLLLNGITHDGKLILEHIYDNSLIRHTVFTHYSPSLLDIITVINVFSNNMFAENIFKYLSLKVAPQGNFTDALKFVKDFWQTHGLDISGMNLYDGSGLTKYNAVTAKFINDLLCYMAYSSNYTDFLHSLPVVGVNGTVSNLFKNTHLEGKAYLKSGSLKGVQCYAGYIDTNDKKYAVVIMVNNFKGKRKNIRMAIEQLILDSIIK